MSNRNGRYVAAFGGLILLLAAGAASGQQALQQPNVREAPAAPENRGPPQPPAATVNAPLQPQPAQHSDRIPDQGSIELGTWPDWAIVLFTAFLAWLSWRQYRLERRLAAETTDSIAIARKSATAAETAAAAAGSQIEIARKAYIAENRPWLGVFSARAAALGLRKGSGARVELTLLVKNTGRTPAHDVMVDARIYAEQRAEPTVNTIKEQFGNRPEPNKTMAFVCLFPGQKEEMTFGVVGRPNEVLSVPEIDGDRHLIFTVAGFISYRSSSVEGGARHETTFVYRLCKSGNVPIKWDGGSLFVVEEDLQLNRWPDGWLAS